MLKPPQHESTQKVNLALDPRPWRLRRHPHSDRELDFASLPGPHKAVVDCTAGWYWLDDLLGAYGIELVLAHAKYLKAISYAKVKTDKVDSETLAKLLWLDCIPRAHKIRRELRDLRDVMRARLRLVQKRTSCCVSIHNLGRKLNCCDQLVIEERSIPEDLSEAYRLHLRNLYEQIDLLDEQVLKLEHHLQPVLIPNDDIQRLVWIPGMGKVTAFTVYLEADGTERFLSDKHFASYCRLVPGAKNSNKSLRYAQSLRKNLPVSSIMFSRRKPSIEVSTVNRSVTRRPISILA